MKVLANGPEPRSDRPATMILHDEPNVRVVAFRLEPGQEIRPHRSSSTVLVQVVEGAGTFTGEGASAVLRSGEAAVFAPGEIHAIRADAEPLRFLAVLTPSPTS